MRTRDEVRSALRAALEQQAAVLAMWEGGSTAFRRDDDLSDLDLYVLAEDDSVEQMFGVVESVLHELGGVSAHLRMPEPSWHGHSQAFYRLTEGAPHLVIDLVVMKRSTEGRFLDRQRHGEPVVFFDRVDEIEPEDIDPAEQQELVSQRIDWLRSMLAMFADFVDKDLQRGNTLGALDAYRSTVLRPLVELLGIRYCPYRYDFGPRYALYEFPADVVERLEALSFIGDPTSLPELRREVEEWFGEIVSEIETHGVEL